MKKKKYIIGFAVSTMLLQMISLHAAVEKCPAQTHWTLLTPGNRLEAEQILEQMLIDDSSTDASLAQVEQLLTDSNLDERTLSELGERIKKYFAKDDRQTQGRALEDKIEIAIAHAKSTRPKENEMYICAPDNESVSKLSIAGLVSAAYGQPTEEVGPSEVYGPNKVRVQYEQPLIDAPGFSDKVRVSIVGSANNYSIPIDSMAAYIKSTTITKPVPASGDISNPSVEDPKAPFTDNFRSTTLPVVQLTLQDIIALGADGQHKVTFSFGEGNQTSASVTYAHDKTTVVFKTFSGATANKTAILPDGYAINSQQILFNQGIGEHLEAGGAVTNQNIPTPKSGSPDVNVNTKTLTAWAKTDHSIGKGDLITRSVVGIQGNSSTHQNTFGIVEDAIYTLQKNRFIGEVILEQETPNAMKIKVTPASAGGNVELMKEFTVGYERTILDKGEDQLRTGASYTRDEAPSNFQDTQPNLVEGHITMDFNWSDIKIGHKKSKSVSEPIDRSVPTCVPQANGSLEDVRGNIQNLQAVVENGAGT